MAAFAAVVMALSTGLTGLIRLAPGMGAWLPRAGLLLIVLPLLAAAAEAAPAAAPTLVLGAEDDAAPWSYADGRGYVNDLVRMVFSSQGWTVKLEVMPYARCKQLALNGTLAGCFTTSREPELEGRLLFPSQPAISPRHLLMVKAGSTLSGCQPDRWASVPTVATVNGYEYANEIESWIRLSKLQPHKVKSESVALQMLALGRVDVAAITVDDVKRLDLLVQGSPLKPQDFKQLCDFGSVPGYVAFSAANPMGKKALGTFERGMAELGRKGSILQLQLRWRELALGRELVR